MKKATIVLLCLVLILGAGCTSTTTNDLESKKEDVEQDEVSKSNKEVDKEDKDKEVDKKSDIEYADPNKISDTGIVLWEAKITIDNFEKMRGDKIFEGEDFEALLEEMAKDLGTSMDEINALPPDEILEQQIEDQTKPTSINSINSIKEKGVYTQDEVDYFKEICFGSEYDEGKEEKVVKKWMDDVKIKVNGSPTKEDLKTLNNVINELNDIISTINISLVEDNENISMYMVPEDEFVKYIPSYVEGNWGFFIYYPNDNAEIYHAKIAIISEDIHQRIRNHIIREELTQSLGMGQDSYKYKTSIFHYEYDVAEDFLNIDRKIIEILYRDDIKPGMSKKQAEEVLQEYIKHQ